MEENSLPTASQLVSSDKDKDESSLDDEDDLKMLDRYISQK